MDSYKAPTASLERPHAGDSRGLAVLIGAAVGLGISYFVLSLSGVVFLWVLTLQGVPAQELYTRAYQSTAYLAFAHTLNFLCFMPGGYWCARLSLGRFKWAPILAGGGVALLALTGYLIPYELPIPLWSRIASVAISVPAFWLGSVWWSAPAKPAGSGAGLQEGGI